MKSKMVSKPKDEGYPRLMKHTNSDAVVMFTTHSHGMVVHADLKTIWYLGEYRQDWNIKLFAPYDGRIMLENGE